MLLNYNTEVRKYKILTKGQILCFSLKFLLALTLLTYTGHYFTRSVHVHLFHWHLTRMVTNLNNE